ncbi:10651_t:CDS:2 [Diversispora eburnea]|uniref:10651_t:CDS:1 n=1 Tax=Diversispora eburnea TaxID=1213867 RepID=A0A9N9BTQ9_9GLOM|nr:10651_t:CDS:2 [Diversispora eburnea]
MVDADTPVNPDGVDRMAIATSIERDHLSGTLLIFGGVNNIKTPKIAKYSLPILANKDIVEMHSSYTVETLHKKQDRYLLLLRKFPL